MSIQTENRNTTRLLEETIDNLTLLYTRLNELELKIARLNDQIAGLKAKKIPFYKSLR